MQVCYMVIDETDSAKTILKKIKGFDGDVHLSATQLRSFLHELQKRRKQMSKPQKIIKNNFAKPEPIRLFSFKNPSTMRCYVP